MRDHFRRDLVQRLYLASHDGDLSKELKDRCWDLAGDLFDEWRRAQEADDAM